MPQLTTEQRVFVVTEYARTQNSTAVQEAFRAQFPERDPPPRSTILRNFRKYQATGTSLNRNRVNSGRPRTGRSDENIQAVRHLLQQNPRNVSARRNGLGIPSATFNRITRLDLAWPPSLSTHR